MYNINVLTEVNFWRDFLSDGQPRFTLSYGKQSLAVATEPLNSSIVWPGVPDDATPFTMARYDEDLFTRSEYDLLLEAERDLDEEFG